jgi:ParB family transcriptional regulator, chromosome partitioning protein
MVTTGTIVPSQQLYEHGRLYEMSLAELQPDPNQPRKYIDPVALEELTESVRQQGVVTPILFRVENGIAYVIAGERRCAAALQAGLTTITAIFMDSPNYEEIALIENMIRQDLNPVEEAEALQRLMDDHAYQQDQLAAIIGKSPATISESLSLNRLPEAIRDECRRDPAVPKRTLIEIARKKQERSMLTAFKKYRDQQAKLAAKLTDDATAPTHRKRTRAEALVNGIGVMAAKIGGLELSGFSKGDRTMIIDAMTSLKDTLDAAIPQVVKGKKKPA